MEKKERLLKKLNNIITNRILDDNTLLTLVELLLNKYDLNNLELTGLLSIIEDNKVVEDTFKLRIKKQIRENRERDFLDTLFSI